MRTFPTSHSRAVLHSRITKYRRSPRLLAFIACLTIAAATVSATSSSARSLRQTLFGKVTALIGDVSAQQQKTTRGSISTSIQEASVPQVSSATLITERSAHTATRLNDGRVLIAGGANSSGVLNQAELFDPNSATFSVTGNMNAARAGHSATLLSDGRVLIAGGRNSVGPLASTEIFDPSTGVFSSGPTLNFARQGHTATFLTDGRLILTGGDKAGNAEIFNPSSNTFTSLGSTLTVARSMHSATQLADGRILIVGGQDGDSNPLTSAEIFDPVNSTFTALGSNMKGARLQAHLRLLFDGKVQVIGGSNDGSMEIFDPATQSFGAYAHLLPETDTCTGLKPGILATQSRAALFHQDQSDPLLDRTGHTITELAGNLALVAGGTNSGGTALSSATVLSSSPASITTDKLDYYPGETVVVTGQGWQPGETVRLTLHEDPHTPLERSFDTVADTNGNLTGTYLVQNYDLSMKFIAAAKGLTSGFRAQTTLSDSPRIDSVTVDSQTGTLSYGTAGSVTYTVTPTRLSDGPVNGALTITSSLPAGVTASFSPNSGTWTANNSDPFPSFTLTLTTSDNSPAGAYAFIVQAADGSDQATGMGTLTIGQSVVTPNVTANDKVYEGNTNATLSSKTLTGVLPGDAGNVTLNATTSVFDNKNVGISKTVTASGLTLSGSAAANYQLSTTSTTTTATIAARAITVQANPNSKTYDGTVNAVATPSITAGSLAAGDTLGFIETYNNKHVGSGKPLTPTGNVNDGNGGNNYAVTLKIAGGTISARPITVRAVTNTKTYDGTTSAAATPTIVTGSLANGDSANFTETYDTKNTGTGKTLTPAGSVNDGNSGNNYNVTFQLVATGAITARALTVTAATNTKTYDGTTSAAASPIVTTGSIASGDIATFSETYDNKNAGTNKTLTPSGSINDGNSGNNYSITFVNANSGIINALAVTVTAVADTKEYDGTTTSVGSPMVTPAVVAGDTSNLKQTFDTKNVGTNKSLTPSGSINDGNSGNNYDVSFVSNTNGVITARQLSITAVGGQTKTYGDADPAFNYQVTTGTLVSGDNLVGALSRVAGENVGSYALMLGSLSAGSNYLLNFVTSDFNIVTRLVTVTADSKSKTYGDDDPAFTCQVTTGSLAFSDTFSGQLTRDSGENVGSYTINQGTLALNANYALTYIGANLTMNPRSVTVTANDKNKTYGDPNPSFDATVSGTVNGDALNYRLSTSATESSPVGSYPITVSLGSNPNYDVSSTDGTLTVSSRAIEVTANAGQTKVYGESDPLPFAYSVTNGSLVAGDNFAGTLSRVAGESVGNYPITQGTLSAGPNYNVSFVSAQFSITTRAISIAADPASKIYGDVDSSFTYHLVSGSLVTGDNFEGNLTRVAGENVGSYAIEQGTVTAGPNYTISFTPANLTINKKDLFVTADNKSMIFGGPVPSFTVTYSAFAAGDSPASLSGSLTFTVKDLPGMTNTIVVSETTPPGSYAIIPGGLSSNNYNVTFVNGTLVIMNNTSAWELRGFYDPVNMSTPSMMALNVINGGSTVPLKFNIFANGVERTSVSDVQSMQFAEFDCNSISAFEFPVDLQATGGASLRYEGGQFIMNWDTPNPPNRCYQVRMTAGDGSHLDAFFKTK